MRDEEDESELEWFEAGKCRMLYKLGVISDPEIFFPEKGESTRPAKDICKGDDGHPPCEVLQQCREHAIENERYGVWGGMSERERNFARRDARRQERLEGRVVVRRDWEPVQ